MARRYSVRTPAIAWVYLGFALLGFSSTSAYNYLAFQALGFDYTPLAFVRAGFEGSPVLGSLAADFWVGSAATVVWMIVEGRQLGMRNLWVYVVLTFITAWACAFPLFLFMRERKVARGGATALYAAARLTGRANPLA
jgi:hypothetical protein